MYLKFWKPRRRRVAFHHTDIDQSIEGIWAGMVDGHYHVLAPKLLMRENQSTQMQGELLIPRAKVAFLQVLADDARK